MDTSWSSTTRILVIVVILLMTIWGAVVASPLLQALGVAALLAYLLNPAVRLLMRRFGLSRPWAARIVVACLYLILAGIPAALGTVAVGWFQGMATDLQAAITETMNWLSRPVIILGFRLEPRILLDNLQAGTGNALAMLPRGSLDILSAVTTNVLWGIVVLGSLYWFLKDGPEIKPRLLELLPAAYQDEIERLIDEVDDVWGKFLRVQLLLFVILTALMAIGTFLAIMLFRTGLLEWSLLGFILLLVLIYTAIQQIDNLWLHPQFLSKQLRMHPGIIFVGLIGGLALSGVLGALIVVPVMASMRVIGQYVYRKLLGLPPWPPETQETAGGDETGTTPAKDGITSSEVQYGQRVALIGMLDRQYGHSLVVGAGGGASSFPWLMRLTRRTTKKITRDTIRKSRTLLIKIP